MVIGENSNPLLDIYRYYYQHVWCFVLGGLQSYEVLFHVPYFRSVRNVNIFLFALKTNSVPPKTYHMQLHFFLFSFLY